MFTKSYVTPNGANTLYHSVRRIEANFPSDFVIANVHSFPSEQALVDGSSPLWTQPVQVPMSSSVSRDGIEAWIVANASGPFVGGTVIPAVDTNLAAAQARRWGVIKASRDAAVAAPKTTSIGQFDADEASQNNLNKVIALVQLSQARGLGATANYTLATNSRVTLTLGQLQTAALEMGAQVQAMYDKGDTLRAQISAATDIPTLEAITWTP